MSKKAAVSYENQQLALAIQLASEFHLGQFDQGGLPYILHPIQVMNNLNTKDPIRKQIAILHDVVEDCIPQVLMKYHSDIVTPDAENVVKDILASNDQEQLVDIVLDIFKQWGFSQRALNALKLMTKKITDVGEDGYFNYIHRMFDNIDAILVKIADIRHNTDILRIKGLDEKDFKRNRKYQIAYAMLVERLEQLFPDFSL